MADGPDDDAEPQASAGPAQTGGEGPDRLPVENPRGTQDARPAEAAELVAPPQPAEAAPEAGDAATGTAHDAAVVADGVGRVALLGDLTVRCAEQVAAAWREGSLDLPDRLCAVLVQVLGPVLDVDGAGVSVLFTPSMSVPVGASGPAAVLAEQVQFTLGEGPCWQAAARRGPVAFADLSDPASPATATAPLYAAQVAAATGFGAAVGCCEQLTAGLPCCVVLYRREGGMGWDGALVAAATRVVVAALAASAQPDERSGLEVFAWLDGAASAARGRVWVAEQLVAEVSGLGADAALDLLRAVAHTRGTVVDELADDLVAGRVTAGALLR